MLHCCSPPTTGRVRVPFRTSKRHISGRTEDWVLQEYQIKELTSRWGQLFATHRTIKRFVDSPDGTPPPEAVLLEFGALLFETLLPGDVKRLFDVARSREQEKPHHIHLDHSLGVRHAMGVRSRPDARHLPGNRGCAVRAQHLHDHPGRSLAAETGFAALADCYVGAGRSRRCRRGRRPPTSATGSAIWSLEAYLRSRFART